MTKPSEIFDTPEADSRVGGNEEIVEEFVEFYGDFFDEYICCAGHGCNCGGKVSLPAVKTWLRTILTTKDQEKEEAIRAERARIVEIIKDELRNAPLEVKMTKGIIFANVINRIEALPTEDNN